MSKVDGGGRRYNGGKARIDLLPTSMIYAAAKVMEYGASKYDDHNWRRGMKWSTPYSCAMRHLLKWFEGAENDEESGESHLGHVLANIAMLVEYEKTCPELDDRFKGPKKVYKDFSESEQEVLEAIADEQEIKDEDSINQMAKYYNE